jgi:CoB--CoM heterodisulfide reductase subunit B
LKYALFVGCTTLSRLPGYEKSTRSIAKKLGIEFIDMPGSSCCGTTYMEGLEEITALALAARNICIAEELGLNIVTICNGCTEVLTKANKSLKDNAELRSKVNEVLLETGHQFKGTVEVKHIVRMLKEDYGINNLRKAVVKPYNGLRVGTHYGCHLLRPSDVMQFEDPNAPTAVDEIVESTGAISVAYPEKMECCGGPVMGIREAVTWSIGLSKVETVKKYADALITSCPFCYITYERSQMMTENNPNLPIVHLPQLIGLALGLTIDEVGLPLNKIDTGVLAMKQRE